MNSPTVIKTGKKHRDKYKDSSLSLCLLTCLAAAQNSLTETTVNGFFLNLERITLFGEKAVQTDNRF